MPTVTTAEVFNDSAYTITLPEPEKLGYKAQGLAVYLTKPRGSPDPSQHRARLGTTAHWPEAVISTAKTSERIVLESEGQTDSSNLGSEGQGLRTSPTPSTSCLSHPGTSARPHAATPVHSWQPGVSEPLLRN